MDPRDEEEGSSEGVRPSQGRGAWRVLFRTNARTTATPPKAIMSAPMPTRMSNGTYHEAVGWMYSDAKHPLQGATGVGKYQGSVPSMSPTPAPIDAAPSAGARTVARRLIGFP
jgi:hypothetical protein